MGDKDKKNRETAADETKPVADGTPTAPAAYVLYRDGHPDDLRDHKDVLRPDKDVAATLEASDTKPRADALRQKQVLVGNGELPEHYVIHYYVYDNVAAPRPKDLERNYLRTETHLGGRIILEDVLDTKATDPATLDPKFANSKVVKPKVLDLEDATYHFDPKDKKYHKVILEKELLETTNTNMNKAIEDAFASYRAQLPGRFVFERVKDPKQADLTFAAVPSMPAHDGQIAAAGTANTRTGEILFATDDFTEAHARASMTEVALHEIQHALGGQHPQDKPEKHSEEKPFYTEKASRFSTVLTYPENNDKSAHPVKHPYGDPASLMPADLQLLIKFYPIAADRNPGGPIVGTPPGLAPDANVTVTIEHANGQKDNVQFPDQSTKFQPITSSSYDIVRVQGNEGSNIQLDRGQTGLVVHSPSSAGTTATSLQPKQIVMSPKVNEVIIDRLGNMVLDNSTPSVPENKDQVTLLGPKNEITMSARDFAQGKLVLTEYLGADVHIELQGSEILSKTPINLKNIFKYDDNRVTDGKDKAVTSPIEVRWARSGDFYRLRAETKDGLSDMAAVYIHLDTKDQKAHAAIQSALALAIGPEYTLEAEDPKDFTMDDIQGPTPVSKARPPQVLRGSGQQVNKGIRPE